MAENTIQLNLMARDQASQVIRGVMGSIQGMLGQLTMLAGIGGAGLGLGALIKQGVEFNKTMEDTKGGIAGVLLMTREYVDATGKVVTGQAAMNAAFLEASGIQEKLKKDALGTAASYTELVGAFQTALAPAAAAGVTNLDDVREITVMATQAMAALNIPTAQAAQELRGLFSGDMGPDNRLNQILRVTKAEIAAVGGDTEKLEKLFRDRLSPAAAAAAMQTGTLTFRLSNLGDIIDQVMGDATAGVFKEISVLVAEVTAGVEENKGVFQDLGSIVSEVFGIVKDVVVDVAGTIGQSAKNAGVGWREAFLGVATVFLGFVETVGGGVKAVTQYLTVPLETIWGAWKTLIFGIVSLFSELVAKFKDLPIVGDFFGAWSSNLDALVVSMTTVDEKFANFEKKADANFGDGFLAKTKAFLDGYGKATEAAGKALDGVASRAKNAAGEAAEAAYHFGTVWAAESAKAAAALEKFLGEFASFTGDKVGEAVAKIEAEYRDLVGQLGQLMFQAKVPFEKGLEMLAQLAKAKGQQITAAIFNGEAMVEDFISVFEAKLTKDDVFVGIRTAWSEVMESIPGAALSAANAVRDVWGSMARTFDDVFYNVLSGRLSSLKDVFKNLWDSLLQTFSRYLSDMLQRWIKTQYQMKATAYGETDPGFVGPPRSAAPGGSGPGVMGYVGAAGAGFGLGSSIGAGGIGNQVGGAVGAVGGLFAGTAITTALTTAGTIAAGSAIGSVIPVLGTIVGALIGAIIGGLFNKSTERSMSGSIGNMWTSSRQVWAPGTRDPDTGERTPGSWQMVTTGPKTAFERAGQDILQAQAAAFSDLFKLGAKDQAKELYTAYTTALRETLSGGNFKIMAGSQEDIEKDAEYLLKSVLPRIGLSAAFGQKGYLPTGYRDKPGGIPGINYGLPGMDESGQWIEKQLFDPEAPIPKMLSGLGFTAERISELAGRISTDDPEKLLAYLQGVVGVVVGLRDLGAEMGKTFDELVKGWKDESAGGPAAAFGKAAKDLAGQFGDLSLYSGDEQLKKAQEAQAAASQFWESVKSYLQQLQALGEKLSAGLQGAREKMRAFLNPLSESGQTAADQRIVDSTWGKLLNATTPAEIEAATNGAAAAIERMFSVLSERVTRGKALIEKTWGLLEKLGSLEKDVAFDQLLKDNPLKAWGQQMEDIQARIGKAASMSGLEQITAMEGVNASAEAMYQNLKGFLSDIANVAASINKSIDSQIWELGVGEMDPAGQAGAITQRIQQLQEELKAATSPAEIAAITSEIQSLTSRYVGTFGKDDPNRADAIAWAQEQLERARGLANETLENLRKQAEDLAKGLEDLLTGSVTMISSNVDDATTAIGQLSHTLGELDKAVNGAITRLGDQALDSLAPLRTAMETAAEIFKGATTAAGTALTAPESGFTAATERSTARLNTFADALDRVIGKLNGSSSESSQGQPRQEQKVVVQGGGDSYSAARVVATVRRLSGQLQPRVGS